MDSENEEDLAPRCHLSDPAHPHTLCLRDNPRSSFCFRCGPIGGNDADHPDADLDRTDQYYYCDICKLVVHEGCHIAPQGTRHPYHPIHPLYFTNRCSEVRVLPFTKNVTEVANLTNEPILDKILVFESNKTCSWCGKWLGKTFYYCFDCRFSLGVECIKEDPPFTITNSKSHQHPLTLSPRPVEEHCSSCGLIGYKELGYACDPCNYLVHKKCIQLHESVDSDNQRIYKILYISDEED